MSVVQEADLIIYKTIPANDRMDVSLAKETVDLVRSMLTNGNGDCKMRLARLAKLTGEGKNQHDYGQHA
jgi:hypothetical protein